MSSILIVRTEPAASETAAELCASGHKAMGLPLLCIRPLSLSTQDRALVRSFQDFDVAIVLSAHAARCFVMETSDTADAIAGNSPMWLAIGPASAAPLSAANIHCQLPKQPAGSEALLDMPALSETQIVRRKVLILQGENARGLLSQTLVERGAKVTRVALYAREPNRLPSDVLETALTEPWSLVLVGSAELVQELAKYRARIATPWPLLVPSPRVAALAQAAGFAEVSVLTNMDATSIHLWMLENTP